MLFTPFSLRSCPSIFFPVPGALSDSQTFSSYSLPVFSYNFFCLFFFFFVQFFFSAVFFAKPRNLITLLNDSEVKVAVAVLSAYPRLKLIRTSGEVERPRTHSGERFSLPRRRIISSPRLSLPRARALLFYFSA